MVSEYDLDAIIFVSYKTSCLTFFDVPFIKLTIVE